MQPFRVPEVKKRLLVLLFVLTPSVSVAVAETADCTGVRDTQWRGGGAVMELRQDGDRVEGIYPGFEGAVQGRVKGQKLSGSWEDAAGNGVLTFVMAPDQQSFMARFGTGAAPRERKSLRRHQDLHLRDDL